MTRLENIWKDTLSKIINEGHPHHKDDSPIREYLGLHLKIPNPMTDLAFVFSNPSRKFVSWARDGAFDIPEYPLKGDALADYITSVDNIDLIYLTEDNDFVYTYPERLKAMHTVNEVGDTVTMNQIDIMVERLLQNRGSNRAVATLYNCGLDGYRVDIPCLNWLQFTIRDDKLILHVMFRSNDFYGAWPSNMYFLTYVGLKVQEAINKKYPSVQFSYIDYHVSSAHIYETDMDMAKKIIEG